MKGHQSKYNSLHKQERKETYTKWVQENIERRRELARNYESRQRLKDPEKSREKTRSRRSLRFNAKGSHTLEQKKQKLEYFGNKCVYCKKDLIEVVMHWDHVIPLSRGGAEFISNLRPSCASCNCSKNDKLISEWQETI